MAKTSINIQPVKGGSEQHNHRAKELDYVRPELSIKNESWISESISDRLKFIKKNTKEKTGRSLQSKATPIREGVIVISEKITLKDLQKFAQKAEDKFGIKAIQIYTHKDEGHYKDQEKKEWKPNLHAHIVFDWTNHETGKSIKLNRQDLAQMQTLLADTLDMDRGVSSDKVHIQSQQFKNEAELRRLQELLLEKEENVHKAKEELKNVKLKANTGKTIDRAVGKLYELLGGTKGEKKIIELEKNNLKLNQELQGANKTISNLSEELKVTKQEVSKVVEENHTYLNALRDLRVKLNSSLEETEKQTIVVFKDLTKMFSEGLNVEPFNNTHIARIFNTGKKLSQEQEHKEQESQNKRRGRSI
jgi:hypothetical protein